MSATSTPRGLEGIVKRMRPSALDSCGPVKTSPEGMLRLPSELTQVRPSTESVRSVPSASMRSSRAGARRSISRAWKWRSSLHAAVASPRSRNSARRTNAANSVVPMPACCAPAAVGHSVTHQRRASAASRTGARARAARAIRPASTCASERVLAGAWMPIEASVACASASSAAGKPSRCASRACCQKPSSAPGSSVRISGHASRTSSSSCSASSSGAASVVERTTTCWPGCTSRQ